MKKLLSFIFLCSMIFTLCGCDSSESTATEPDQGSLYETSGIIGVRNGRSIRFEDFGLTAVAPQEVSNDWTTDVIPQTFEELNSIIDSEECYMINWTEFETKQGSALFNIQVFTCEEETIDRYIMDYFAEDYPITYQAQNVEVKKMQIGDNPKQNCFTANYVNDQEQSVNVLIFDRISGPYRIECMVQTFGWNGAEELAQRIFSVDAPEIVQFETSGLVGKLKDDTLRFEDFSLSVIAPDAVTADEWEIRKVPKTRNDLDNAMTGNDDSLCIFWNDMACEHGPASVSANIFHSSAYVTEDTLLTWATEYFTAERGASACEIISVSLGDNRNQKCLLVTYLNDSGKEENLLTFYKIHEKYYIGCEVSTVGWKGAQEIAEQLIRVDAPKELPFAIGDSGLLTIKDPSLFGKSIEELREILGSFPVPESFPWWDDPLTYANVDCDGYPVSLLFDMDNKLYAIICEDVEGKKFESAFADAEKIYSKLYYYWTTADTSYYTDGKSYEFFADDVSRLALAKCNNDHGGVNITQRYIAGPLPDNEMFNSARAIMYGQLPDLKPEHGLKLAIFAAQRSGDTSAMIQIGHAYANVFMDPDTALQWCHKALDLGDLSAMNDIGYLYDNAHNDPVQSLEWYSKSADNGNYLGMINCAMLCIRDDSRLIQDWDKAADYLLCALETSDEWEYYLAKSSLFAMRKNNANAFSADIWEKVDSMFTKIETDAKSGDVTSMVELARLYNGKLEDRKTAIQWYAKAAKAGDASAANAISTIYLNQKDFSKALEWAEKGAQMGNPDAALTCGKFYYGSVGNVKPDYNKASEYFLLALESENEDTVSTAKNDLITIWRFFAKDISNDMETTISKLFGPELTKYKD